MNFGSLFLQVLGEFSGGLCPLLLVGLLRVNLGLFRGVCNLSLFSIRLHSITEKGFLSEFLRFVLPYSNGVINGKKIC